MMRMFFVIVSVMATAGSPSNAWHRQESLLAKDGLSATPQNITSVVAGKSCKGPNDDFLKFGVSVSGQPGEFVHSGQVVATYQVGYASLFITRGGELHSHVITVSPGKDLLHFNGGNYQC